MNAYLVSERIIASKGHLVTLPEVFIWADSKLDAAKKLNINVTETHRKTFIGKYCVKGTTHETIIEYEIQEIREVSGEEGLIDHLDQKVSRLLEGLSKYIA